MQEILAQLALALLKSLIPTLVGEAETLALNFLRAHIANTPKVLQEGESVMVDGLGKIAESTANDLTPEIVQSLAKQWGTAA